MTVTLSPPIPLGGGVDELSLFGSLLPEILDDRDPADLTTAKPSSNVSIGMGSPGSVFMKVARVIRGALPTVLVATLIPMALFYTAMTIGSIRAAIVVSLVWAYSAFTVQFIRKGRLPGMLTITVFMATIRAVASFASGSSFVYFVVPVLETAGFAMLFFVTLFTDEPLIVRLARDFVPHIAEEFAERTELVTLLSVVWTGVYLCSGATTMALLSTQPVSVYIGAHTLSGWMWTSTGCLLSVLLCKRRARGLFAAAIA